MRRDKGSGVAAVIGLAVAAVGMWGLVAAGSFADFIDFPPENVHLIHDVGAFQLGLGATLLLGALWGDGLAVALAGFFVANTAHTVNHVLDMDLGGRDTDWILLALVSVLVGWTLAVRLRQLGYVVGRVADGASERWLPFLRQKTVLVTSYRRDGTPVPVPVSIAVDGDVGYFRTWHTTGKAKRLRRNPNILIGPSTMKGRPTGTPVPAKAELLSGDEERRAARLLARKYPGIHNMIPLGHRLMRVRTLHYRVTLT